MKIQAYLPVYNESDVLPHVLAHLRSQGIYHIHLIDGWSMDRAIETFCGYENQGVTFERFPASSSPIQDCHAILKRIEDLAAASDADWIMYTDADEWRRSPRASETLADGIARVDAEGWNVIDYRVFAFFCTDQPWEARSGKPELALRHYNETDPICLIPNQKTWKNLGRVDLQSSGGHCTRAPWARICPERWSMKHYPFRTPEQARAKLLTRLARRCKPEHAAGWGVHYDPLLTAVQAGLEMRWRADSLEFWNADPTSALP